MVRTDTSFSHASVYAMCALGLSNLRLYKSWPRRRPPCLNMTSFQGLLGLSCL